MGEDASSKGYMIVPGSPSASCSKSEEDLFILGLYIFGKNLKAVKIFVQTKEMGDILAHYYDKFFNIESYCRWAKSRRQEEESVSKSSAFSLDSGNMNCWHALFLTYLSI